MITAEEARTLAVKSQEHLKVYLDRIDTMIRAAAMVNKRSVPLYIDDLWSSVRIHSSPKATPLQERVMAVLRDYPYSFGVKLDADGAPYIPRGSSDGIEHVNFVITVSF